MAEKLLDRNGEPFRIRILPPKPIRKTSESSKKKTQESVSFKLPLPEPESSARMRSEESGVEPAVERLVQRYLHACDVSLEDERHVLQSCGCCVGANIQAKLVTRRQEAESGYFISTE